MKAYMFLADGFEEVEALTVVDVLRRGSVDIRMMSITGDREVLGSHKIRIKADGLFWESDYSDGDIVILPGGKGGTDKLSENEGVHNVLRSYCESGKKVAAICAAPSVLGRLGLLEGKKATCYPGFEDKLKGAVISKNGPKAVGSPFEIAGNIITGRSMGTALDFALTILEELMGKEIRGRVEESLVRQ